MKAKVHQDVWVGIVIILACAGFFTLTRGKPGDSMAFPVILLAILALMAIPVIIGGVRKTQAATPENPIENTMTLGKLKVPLAALLFVAGYVFLFWLSGYFVATVIFLPSLMVHFKLKNPLQIALITLGYVLVIYFMFVKQLNVPVLHFGYIGRMLNS